MRRRPYIDKDTTVRQIIINERAPIRDNKEDVLSHHTVIVKMNIARARSVEASLWTNFIYPPLSETSSSDAETSRIHLN